MRILTLFLMPVFPALAWAQAPPVPVDGGLALDGGAVTLPAMPPAPDEQPVVDVPPAPPEVVPGPPGAVDLHAKIGDSETDITAAEVLAAGKEAAHGVGVAVSSKTLAAIFGAIAGVLWALIATLRRFGHAYLSGRAIRIITLIAVPAATLFGAVAAGMSWPDALWLTAAGPGALLLNEVLVMLGINISRRPAEAGG